MKELECANKEKRKKAQRKLLFTKIGVAPVMGFKMLEINTPFHKVVENNPRRI